MYNNYSNRAFFQEPRFYKTQNSISEEIRIQTVELLNQTLATTIDLRSQVRQAIWSMRGPGFYQMYLLLNEIVDQMERQVDAIAQRISALASTPLVSIRSTAQASQLSEYPFDVISVEETIDILIEKVGFQSRHLRLAIEQTNDLEEANTASLYAEISRETDQCLWLLEAHRL